jgi:hypothetical protein
MTFEIRGEANAPSDTRIEIAESQLMTDTLKDVTHKISIHPIEIIPADKGSIISEKKAP